MNTETAIPVTPSDSTEPFVPAPTGRTACVVGAGFGGLALAIRIGVLQTFDLEVAPSQRLFHDIRDLCIRSPADGVDRHQLLRHFNHIKLH